MSILFSILNESISDDEIYQALKRNYGKEAAKSAVAGAASGVIGKVIRTAVAKARHKPTESGKDLLKSMGRRALIDAAASTVTGLTNAALYNNGVKRGLKNKKRYKKAGYIGAAGGAAAHGIIMAGSDKKFSPYVDPALTALAIGAGYIGGQSAHTLGYRRAKELKNGFRRFEED